MAFSASIIFKGVDGVTAPIKRMQASTEMFALTASASFSKIGSFSTGLANKMESLSSKMIGFKSIIAGGIVVTAVKGLYDMALASATASDEQIKFARRVDISLQSFKELNYAANRSGISTGELTKWFEKLERGMGHLKMNTGELYSFLAANDRSLLSNLKKAKNNEQAFDLMVNAVSKVKNPMLRATLAAAAFGEKASKMTNLLIGGTAGLKKMREEYRKFAGDNATAAMSSEQLIASQIKMNAAWSSVKNSIGFAAIPSLTKVMDSLSEWMAANRKMLKENISSWIKTLAGSFLFLVKHLNIILPAIIAYTSALVFLKVATVACKTFTVLATAATWAFTLAADLASISQNGLMLATLKGTAALKLATAWIWLTSAATWSWTAALLANPITWVVSAVLALGAALYFTIKYWDNIKKAVDDFSNTGIGAFLGMINPIQLILHLISFMQDRWDGIKKAFSDGGFLHGILAIGKAIMSFILQPIQSILKAIGEVTGFELATNGSKSIGDTRAKLDKDLLPVNKDVSIITQKKILETNSSQNVQINIDDSTGRARVGGNTSAIPVLINNTKSFDWYGRKD